MSDSAEIFQALRDDRKEQRRLFGVPCPECVRLLPKAHPTILLPQGRCRIHKYVDPRPYGLIEAHYAAKAIES